jgi:prephenate dehydrogenase
MKVIRTDDSAFSTVGIVGLGLIGGSLAKAVRAKTDCRVLGFDGDEAVNARALSEGVIEGVLNAAALAYCEIVIVALYPQDVINWCAENFPHMKPGTLIVDCAGVKTSVCDKLVPLAAERGLQFVGGHPMAGIERSGYENSFAGLFEGATMILCEDQGRLREFFLSLGFGSIKVTTPREHDRIIAYTSQLAHLVSSAYIHGDTRGRRYGFSAGSFKDLTRVARLNPDMWTKLFFENRESLLKETDELIANLQKYRDALAGSDAESMYGLLRTGSELKIRDEAGEQAALLS